MLLRSGNGLRLRWSTSLVAGLSILLPLTGCADGGNSSTKSPEVVRESVCSLVRVWFPDSEEDKAAVTSGLDKAIANSTGEFRDHLVVLYRSSTAVDYDYETFENLLVLDPEVSVAFLAVEAYGIENCSAEITDRVGE